jgi:hypothetical protein
MLEEKEEDEVPVETVVIKGVFELEPLRSSWASGIS